jgi:hypothetical protein
MQFNIFSIQQNIQMAYLKGIRLIRFKTKQQNNTIRIAFLKHGSINTELLSEPVFFHNNVTE